MREQEVAMYMDAEGAIKPVTVLDVICRRIPIHVAVGGIADLIPPHVHPALVDPKSGRVFASVTTIENVGHLVRLFPSNVFLVLISCRYRKKCRKRWLPIFSRCSQAIALFRLAYNIKRDA